MKLPKTAMGAWAWGDTDGYFGNTMSGEEFRPTFDAAMRAGISLQRKKLRLWERQRISRV